MFPSSAFSSLETPPISFLTLAFTKMSSLRSVPASLLSFLLFSVLLLSCHLPVSSLTHSIPLPELHKYKGRLLGSGTTYGDCATAVQTIFDAANQPLGPPTTWRRGKRVVDTPDMPAGTAVGSFRGVGVYEDRAAVYERQNVTHVIVWDQQAKPMKKFGPRVLPKWVKGAMGGADLYAIDTLEDREL